jgi:hypothetical protein
VVVTVLFVLVIVVIVVVVVIVLVILVIVAVFISHLYLIDLVVKLAFTPSCSRTMFP